MEKPNASQPNAEREETFAKRKQDLGPVAVEHVRLRRGALLDEAAAIVDSCLVATERTFGETKVSDERFKRELYDNLALACLSIPGANRELKLRPSAERYVRRIAASASDVEKIVDRGFLFAHRNDFPDTEDGDERFRGALFYKLKLLCLSFVEGPGGLVDQPPENPDGQVLPDWAGTSRDLSPDEKAIQADLIAMFLKLTPRERQVLEAIYIFGKSLKEAADDMGISEPTARKARKSGIEKLRRWFGSDARVDFGEAQVIIGGVEEKAHLLCVDLPHSDDGFVMAFPDESTESNRRKNNDD